MGSHLRRRSRAGLTLVEMLVGMAITLLLVLALVEMFQRIGATISEGRAALEISGQMRSVEFLLQHDLDNVTVPVRPWSQESGGMGYLEYIEGWGRDSMATFHAPGQAANSMFGDWDDRIMFTAYSSSTPFVGNFPTATDAGWGVFNVDDDGDGLIDDAGEMGLPGSDDRPFSIESNNAEIVWWATLDDKNNNGVQDPAEDLTIRRRVLLLRPDLNDDGVDINGNPRSGFLRDPRTGQLLWLTNNVNLTAAQYTNLLFDLEKILNITDISVRLHLSHGRIGLRANSLADLTRRENRFSRFGLNVLNTTFPISQIPGYEAVHHYPYPSNPQLMFRKRAIWMPGSDGEWGEAGVDDNLNGTTDDVGEAGTAGSDDVLISDARGEDIVLANAIAFDVKAFDPQAIIQQIGTQRLIYPGDPGYDPRFSYDNNGNQINHFVNNVLRTDIVIPQGAYVDLYYAYGGPYPAPLLNSPVVRPYDTMLAASWLNIQRLSPFSGQPAWKSGLNRNYLVTNANSVLVPIQVLPSAVYDTWSFHYEHDGINNDGPFNLVDDDGDNQVDELDEFVGGLIDEGTDGLDNPLNLMNNSTGFPPSDNFDDGPTDSPAERETSPPYPYPLRGIQVTLRAIERDSRQVRQASIVSDFTPE